MQSYFFPHFCHIKRGNSIYKASDLRVGKQLHASHIEAAHAKIHAPSKSADKANATVDTSKPLLVKNWNVMDIVASGSYKNHNPEQMFRFVHRDSNGAYPIKISKNALDALDAELEQPLIETGDVSLSGRTALLPFGEYLSAATSMSATCGGGWGRDKEDDDEKWVCRCARMATHMCKPKAITVGRKPRR